MAGRMLTIYYDQDEVLNMFSEAVVDIYNKDYNEDYDWKRNTKMWWGDLGKATPEYFKDLINKPGFFRSCGVMEGSREYMQKLIEDGFSVGIITHPQWNEHCPGEKVTWLQEHFPFFDLSNLHMTQKKAKMADPCSILLDDNTSNLVKWQAAGGIAVAFDQGWNQDWEGYRVKSHEEFYQFVKIMEDAFNGRGIAFDSLRSFLPKPQMATPAEMAEGSPYGEVIL